MNTEEKFFGKIKKLILILIPIPLLIGTIGYYISGQTPLDSLYLAIRLYGLEWESGAKNIYIESARWTAPLMTVAGLATIIKSVYAFLRSRLISLFHKDATAIYSRSDSGRLLSNSVPYSILCEKQPLKHVKNHIILFDSDEENLLFYQKNKSYFQNEKRKKTVYICLKEVDSCMLKEDLDNVRIFNANDIIARDLWKKIKVWNCTERQKTQKIAILGFDGLGQRILHFGLQLNLYAKEQCVEYHVFGDSELYEASHRHFRTMNKDVVCFHEENDADKWELLQAADYIIVARAATIELLQGLHYGCDRAKIYYYNPAGEKITEYLKTDRLYAYGEDSLIFTNEYIRTDKLYENAKKMNYDYLVKANIEVSKDMEEEWRKLDGFTKGSNISSSDYREVVCELDAFNSRRGIKMELEEYAELEHVRWCRYNLLNGWKYGVPENGKNKDPKLKIHNCLCSYAELAETEKEKDRQVIINNLAAKQ